MSKHPIILMFFVLLVCFYAVVAHAYQVNFLGSHTQGGLVIGKVLPGMKIIFQGKPVRVSQQGYFLIGFDYQSKLEVEYVLQYPNGKKEVKYITISAREFKQERIEGLANSKVNPDQHQLKRIAKEQLFFDQARLIDEDRDDFLQRFIWPVKGRVSGVYGSRRVLNGVPKRPHYGLDIAAAQGTDIIAPAAGVVSLNQSDLFYTGGTVMLDHGHGLSTLYIHMSESVVKLGQQVNQGEVIGKVGQTGRATGPHLHWGMSLFNTRLDPQLMLNDPR